MQQSPSWEAKSVSDSQEIPCLLCNLKVHYHAHKTLSLKPTVSEMILIHILTPYFFKIHFDIVLPSEGEHYKINLRTIWCSGTDSPCFPSLILVA